MSLFDSKLVQMADLISRLPAGMAQVWDLKYRQKLPDAVAAERAGVPLEEFQRRERMVFAQVRGLMV